VIFLGLLIAAAAVGLGVGAVLDNATDAQLTFFGNAVPGITSTWHVFLAGAVVALVFMGGMIVGMLGIGRAARVRRELRDLRDEHEESLTTLEMEKRHLQRELARARQQPPAQAPTPAQTQASVPPQHPRGPGSKVSSSRFFDPSR
jgi:uncharacterized integral membrane protein